MDNYELESNELAHYGVKGMKWGVRKKVRSYEAYRKSDYKESVKSINEVYNNRIKKQKALTKASKGSNPTVHKLSKETEKWLRNEKKHNLAAAKDQYKYHYSNKGDKDKDTYARLKDYNINIRETKRAYKKNPSDINKIAYERALFNGLAFKKSPAYKRYMTHTYAAMAISPAVAIGRNYLLEREYWTGR